MGACAASAELLASYLLPMKARHDLSHTIAATEYRMNLVKLWNLRPGSKILEIGPGQGDFTVVLADAVGDDGHVTAVDPADLEDGTPTYGEAREFVLASEVGKRITFVKDDPAHFLSNSTDQFDAIIFCHCIWYFANPDDLKTMATLARERCSSLLVAEYGLVASTNAALPHVLAALAVNALESFRDESSKRNIRCALSPGQIRQSLESAGWKETWTQMETPPPAARDGWREVKMALHKWFPDDVQSLDVSDKVRSMLLGLQFALQQSVDKVEGGMDKICNMDCYLARFVKE